MKPAAFSLWMLGLVSLSAAMAVTPPEGLLAIAEAPTPLDEILGIHSAPGAFVTNVDPDSPAARVGLDACDLIAGFNEQDFRKYGNINDFSGAFREAAMFSGADLEVWKSSDSGQTYHKEHVKLKIPLQPGSKIGAYVTFQVLIHAIAKGGPADAAGVEAGEFLDQVNGLKVTDMRNVLELDQRIGLAAREDGRALLTLARWKPVRGSAIYKTSSTTREVLVRFDPRVK